MTAKEFYERYKNKLAVVNDPKYPHWADKTFRVVDYVHDKDTNRELVILDVIDGPSRAVFFLPQSLRIIDNSPLPLPG